MALHVFVIKETELEDPQDLRAEYRKFLNSTNERKNMSTKTLRKRIALVAVAGLGFGLLSATTASADIDVTEIGIIAPTAGTLGAVGVCSVASTAEAGSDAISTGTVVAVGATLSFEVGNTTTDGSLTISGPAIWSAANTGTTINATASKLDDLTATSTPGDTTLKTTGVGSVTVTAKNDAGVAVKSISIAVVAACSSATTPAAANTLLGINSVQATTDGTDESLSYDEKDYDSTVWVNIVLRNGYKGNVSAGLLTATATNGALIAFDGATALSSTAFISTAATADEGMGLSVEQDTDTNPGKALTTTITFAFNGVTVGTKTVTILGTPASITVSDVVGGITPGSGSFEYVVKDNAGNSVESPAFAGINWTVAGFEAGDVLTDVAATSDYASTDSFATKGTGTIDCASADTKSSGSVDVAIGFLDAALNVIKSNTFKASCGGAADTFSVALDKAVYSTGEIATLTITAKDENGAAVGDGVTVGDAIAADLGGLEIIGSAAATTDEFSGGVKTYKFRVLQNTGSFVGQAKITASTDTSVKTLQYKIVASDSGTSMEDVLKAIVSLIASINKQIAALQKALLKKK
jgi:trimeric autotransporter adhesin